MKHPILEGTGYKLYTISWAVIGTVQVLILYHFYDLPLLVSVLDSIVFNFTFLILGIGFWYIVRYAQPDTRDVTGLF